MFNINCNQKLSVKQEEPSHTRSHGFDVLKLRLIGDILWLLGGWDVLCMSEFVKLCTDINNIDDGDG